MTWLRLLPQLLGVTVVALAIANVVLKDAAAMVAATSEPDLARAHRDRFKIAQEDGSQASLRPFNASADWLVFVHVPKCGGTSLGEILLHEYGAGCGSSVQEWAVSCASIKGRPNISSFEYGQAQRICPIWGCLGHMAAVDVHELFQLSMSSRRLPAADAGFLVPPTPISTRHGNIFMVTLVRDPIARLVSEYQYVLSEIRDHHRIQFLDPAHRKAIVNTKARMSIVDYAKLEGSSFALGSPSNRATWQLQRRRVSDLRPSETETILQIALADAMDSLGNDFIFVGVLEAWELSLATLAMTLSGNLEESIAFAAKAAKIHRRLGKARHNSPLLTDDDIVTLKELNWADRALYRFAANILYARAQALGIPERLLSTLSQFQ